jgi:autotransporter-associated beta strand protein
MPSLRRVLVAVAVLGLCSPAFGQITWNFTFSDAAGSGFNDGGVDGGETLSRGQLRRNSITAATNYLDLFLDGRGTANINWNASINNPNSGVLASFGPSQLTHTINTQGVGSFQNGGIYQGARSNDRPFAGADGSGQFNFGHGWNYAGQNNPAGAGNFDMVTVLIHEVTHGLGFAAFTNSAGQGLLGNATGTPDIYSGYAKFMQRGNGPLATSGLFNTDITSANFGSFTGDASTFTNENDAATGLFFGGPLTREVFGGAAPLYAPGGYQPGSSVSHVNDPTAVMNPFVAPDQVKRFQPYEIAMLLDIGWNQYTWNSTDGNFGDGIGDLASSRWGTDSGIVYDGTDVFNVNGAADPAPVLPPYAQTTSNIIFTFRATGVNTYTATNDLGTVRLSRLNLSSTSTAPVFVAGGVLNFGENDDGSPSVLVPKIVQSGSGEVEITSSIQVNDILPVVIDGVQFDGHSGLTVEGFGSGRVSLVGEINGTGGLTKNGLFTLVLGGTSSYSGTTTVNGGTLIVDNDLSNSSIVLNGGVLGGNGFLFNPVTVFSGAAVEAGNSIGTLSFFDRLTIEGGGTLRAELGAGTDADLLAMSEVDAPLNLVNGSTVALVNNGEFNAAAVTTFQLADLNGTGESLLQLNGGGTPTNIDITVFTSTGGNAGTVTNPNGSVNLTLTGFNLTAGDKFTLRRDAAGDLVVVFTPVPEPATLLVVCGLVAGGGAAWRRWKRTPA